jgi:hypothetical protein
MLSAVEQDGENADGQVRNSVVEQNGDNAV